MQRAQCRGQAAQQCQLVDAGASWGTLGGGAVFLPVTVRLGASQLRLPPSQSPTPVRDTRTGLFVLARCASLHKVQPIRGEDRRVRGGARLFDGQDGIPKQAGQAPRPRTELPARPSGIVDLW